MAGKSRLKVETGMDVLMVLLYAPGAKGEMGEKIRGITKLEKLIYLLWKEGGFDKYFKEDFEFEAYKYGPYSVEIYDSIEALKEAGLLKTETRKYKSYVEIADATACVEQIGEADFEEDKTVEVYSLTEDGKKIGKMLFDSLSEEEKKNLIKIKTIYNSMPLTNLLRQIYTKYPEAAEKSVIKDKILR
ncbi:MAG: hypothetical protein ACTSP1_12280 [Candidatus Freyarchaeota archaeon]